MRDIVGTPLEATPARRLTPTRAAPESAQRGPRDAVTPWSKPRYLRHARRRLQDESGGCDPCYAVFGVNWVRGDGVVRGPLGESGLANEEYRVDGVDGDEVCIGVMVGT